MNNLKHKKVFCEVVRLSKNNNIISPYIKYIVLLGSVLRNEAVENYSDLDILFIIDSNKSGTVPLKVLKELKKIGDETSRGNNIELSLLPHTIFDLKEYVDFNYLIHYSWGKVVCGDKNNLKKLFKNIIIEKYSNKKRKDLIYYNLIHARFNLLRKYISWNENNKQNYRQSIIKLFIDNIIEICDWALIYRNIFKKNKKDVIGNFIKEYSKLKYKNVAKNALKIRFKWNKQDLSKKNLDTFLRESILLIEEIIKIIHEEHKKN